MQKQRLVPGTGIESGVKSRTCDCDWRIIATANRQKIISTKLLQLDSFLQSFCDSISATIQGAAVQNNHLPYLDGWRGLAIAFLLVGHFFPVRGIDLGAFGVNLFFVLSGLLMARILFIDKVPIATFYRRRISRIFPGVFAFLLVIAAAYPALGMDVEWPQFLAAATFTNNYFTAVSHAPMPFQHIWSLSVEEHSYVVLSLLAIAVRRQFVRARFAIGGVAALSAVVGIVYWAVDIEGGWWSHTEVAAFAIFCSALVLVRWKMPLTAWGAPALMVTGLALHWWSVPSPVRIIVGCGALALAVNSLSGAHPMVRTALSFAPLRQLGIWSFSIYLWQQPLYLLVSRHGLPQWVGLILGVCAGVLSYYVIERPARAYLNSRSASRRPAAPRPTSTTDASPAPR